MVARRAGGHIDRGDGKGWVIDDSPVPALPEPQPHKPLQPTVQVAGGWVLSPPAEPAPEPALKLEQLVEEAPSVSDVRAWEEAPSDAEVRAWARAAGIEVPTRGRLSKEVVDQYLNREM